MVVGLECAKSNIVSVPIPLEDLAKPYKWSEKEFKLHYLYSDVKIKFSITNYNNIRITIFKRVRLTLQAP